MAKMSCMTKHSRSAVARSSNTLSKYFATFDARRGFLLAISGKCFPVGRASGKCIRQNCGFMDGAQLPMHL